MIKNLIFKGGGVLGIAYAGAIRELEYKGILQNIERVAGTSAGAITAALVTLKYTGAEIQDIVSNTDFSSFEDRENPMRVLSKYGIYAGDAFLEWIQSQLIKKGFDKSATFEDLSKAGCLDLHVFATDLNERGLKRFSYAETPKVIVCEAVRASMSIPFFFKAWRFSNNLPDMHIYVDGGAVYNYPLTAFDMERTNEETIGLFLSDLNDKSTPSDLSYDELIKYVKALAETVLNSQNINMASDADEMARTIMIDDLGISATNFHITSAQKIALFQSGMNAVKSSTKV